MPRFLNLDPEKKNPDWEIVFSGGVNAGDSAPIMYESPFEKAYGLWLLKTHQKPREHNAAMEGGIVTEPLVKAWYEQFKGMTGVGGVWAVYDEAEWVRGLGDFWNNEKRHGAEFKSPQRDDSADHVYAKELRRVPHHYLLQCIHLMEVYDALSWDYVSWRSPEDNVVIPVQRDTDYWLTEMLPRYEEFWRRVQERNWPMPNGTELIQDEEWNMHAKRYLGAVDVIREATEIKKRAEAALTRMAETAKTTKGGGVRASWKNWSPRYEVGITADDSDAQGRIIKALAPMEGKQGVKKIKTRFWPPNITMTIKAEAEPEAEPEE